MIIQIWPPRIVRGTLRHVERAAIDRALMGLRIQAQAQRSERLRRFLSGAATKVSPN